MRRIFHIILFLLSFQTAFAQELPLNSQIFLNPYYYNPAYAGFEDRPAFYVYRRQQWTGIEGAPVTTGFNFHTIFNEKVNFGVHIMNDERSILNTTRTLLTFGYRASFGEFHYLSFALSGGIGFNSIDLDAIDPNDPAIIDALDNNLFLDGNAGFNYYNKGFNLGLSLPKIFKSKTISDSGFDPGEISPLNDAIFMSSYKWEISEEKFAIEPHAIYYYTKDLPGQFEVIGLMHLMDVFWFGASYRQDYGTTGFVGLNIKGNFKFGYAYEFFNVQPANFNNGTHDIQLALVFGEKKKKGKVNLMAQRRNMLRTMGKLPSEQEKNIYQVEKDPAVPPPAETETYNEEDALQDLLDEMTDEQAVQEDTMSFEELEAPVEEDETDIFNIQFDEEEVSEPEVAPIIIPAIIPEPEPEDETDIFNIQFDDEEVSELEVAPIIIPAIIPEPEPEDETDIFNIQFDDEEVSEPEVEPEIIPEVIPEPEIIDEEDEIDIFNIQFDDEEVSELEVAPVIIPPTIREPEKMDEEEALIRQMDEDAQEEFTFDEQEELTEATEDLFEDADDAPTEYIEPTLDDEGLYIGPTTVIKGSHLLELDKSNYVVVGTFSSYRDAEEHSDQLFIQGFYTKFGYISQTKIYYVYIFENEDLQEANDTSERFNMIGAQFKENWVLQVQ